jgi:protein-L-isoaspartate(D-aspartate) O-methyltransferase
LIEQLVVGGRLIIPVGERDVQMLYKFTRLSKDINDLKTEDLGGCRFVSLIGDSGWKE